MEATVNAAARETARTELVEDPVLRQRLRFPRELDDDGEVLHVEIWLDPRGGVTPHVHPRLQERFEVLAGRPSFLSGRVWRTAAPGDTVVVPPGARHAYRSRANETVHMICHARPPSTLQEFLESVAALSRAGKITRHGLPTRPGAALEALRLARRHRDMVVLGFPPLPPRAIQRLLFALVGGQRGGAPGLTRPHS